MPRRTTAPPEGWAAFTAAWLRANAADRLDAADAVLAGRVVAAHVGGPAAGGAAARSRLVAALTRTPGQLVVRTRPASGRGRPVAVFWLPEAAFARGWIRADDRRLGRVPLVFHPLRPPAGPDVSACGRYRVVRASRRTWVAVAEWQGGRAAGRARTRAGAIGLCQRHAEGNGE